MVTEHLCSVNEQQRLMAKSDLPSDSLAARLRDARERANLDQVAAARAIGKDGPGAAGYISRLERGAVEDPRSNDLLALAQLYGVSVDWLLTGKQSAGASGRVDRELLGRIQQAIARVYREEGVALDELELGRIGADELNAVGEVSPDEWHVVARLIAEQHRHRLRTESMASRRAVSGSYKDGA